MCQKTQLPIDEKLAALRAGDSFREWNSLDDKHVCILCDETIAGRQIEVIPARGGGYKVYCPTKNCHSTPHEWAYPGNRLLSEKAWQDWERVFDEETNQVSDGLETLSVSK